MWFITTLIIGIAGGSIALKLKIPAGAIIGALMAVSLLNILTGNATFPQEFKILTQAGTGAFIGSQIRKKDVIELKCIIKPAIILTVSLCLFGIIISIFLNRNANINLVTALFATAPAGLTDMTLISVDFGADSAKVASLQFIRLISVISIMPTLIKYFASRVNKNDETIDGHVSHNNIKKSDSSQKDPKEVLKKTVLTLILGFIFGYIGYLSGIPAATISFAMIACAFYNTRTSNAYMPLKLRKAIQFLSGSLIGARITMIQVIEMKEMLPIILVIVLGFLILNFALAYLIVKYSDLDIVTALYSSAPGGLTDMAIIASEMGADAPKVAVLQFVRVVGIIVFYPIIIKTLLNVIN